MEANYPGMPEQQAVLTGAGAVASYTAGQPQQKSNGPAGQWRSGQIQITKWVNTRNFNGRQVETESYVIEKKYKDQNGEWKSTKYLTKTDLMKAYFLLQKVLTE